VIILWREAEHMALPASANLPVETLFTNIDTQKAALLASLCCNALESTRDEWAFPLRRSEHENEKRSPAGSPKWLILLASLAVKTETLGQPNRLP